MSVPHIPALRRGQPYESLDKAHVLDHRSGALLGTVSQVNPGIIRKDVRRLEEARAALARFGVQERLALCARAGELFLDGTLPVGDKGVAQSPDDYVRTLSGSSGLPHVMVRRSMRRIHDALVHMPTVLNGLTRGLDLTVLDRGHGEQFGTRLGFYPTTNALGVVMPSNSPAVNSLWLPAIPLATPVVLKPGRDEPWTPYRLIQAFVAAGCPAEAFSFYPTDHEGAAEILRLCGRALVFGDLTTTAPYAQNPAIQVHGPGFSKILIGRDEIGRWPDYLDLMADSICENGGRSCINASAIVVPDAADEIADALARVLGPIQPAPLEDKQARLAGFASPKMADAIEAIITQDLQVPGAEDITARYRNGPRKVVFQGGTYLRPTLVRCDAFTHPLANREFLFPYASVVQVPEDEMLEVIGPSLVVTAITRNPALRTRLLRCPLIERLNLGPVPTIKVSWDQPHEGNLFEFLYKRRSIEVA